MAKNTIKSKYFKIVYAEVILQYISFWNGVMPLKGCHWWDSSNPENIFLKLVYHTWDGFGKQYRLLVAGWQKSCHTDTEKVRERYQGRVITEKVREIYQGRVMTLLMYACNLLSCFNILKYTLNLHRDYTNGLGKMFVFFKCSNNKNYKVRGYLG